MTTESNGRPAQRAGSPRRPGSPALPAVVLLLLAACGGTVWFRGPHSDYLTEGPLASS